MSMQATFVRRLAPIAALAALLALSAAGCAAGTTAAAPAPAPAPVAVPPPALSPLVDAGPQRFCAALMALYQDTGQSSLATNRAGIDQAASDRAVAGWSQVAAVAPAEVKADVARMSEAARQLGAGTLRSDDMRETLSASRHLGEYTSQHCAAEKAAARAGG